MTTPNERRIFIERNSQRKEDGPDLPEEDENEDEDDEDEDEEDEDEEDEDENEEDENDTDYQVRIIRAETNREFVRGINTFLEYIGYALIITSLGCAYAIGKNWLNPPPVPIIEKTNTNEKTNTEK